MSNDAPWDLIRRVERENDAQAQRIAHLEATLTQAVQHNEVLLAERANAYAALSEQGRSAADVSGNLDDGVNWDQLAHSAEVSGLVEELAAVRGERDRLACQVEAAGRLITEMTGMVGGSPVRHYASCLRTVLGLPNPNPCRCYACKKDGGEPDAG